jgi:hypothetical protein
LPTIALVSVTVVSSVSSDAGASGFAGVFAHPAKRNAHAVTINNYFMFFFLLCKIFLYIFSITNGIIHRKMLSQICAKVSSEQLYQRCMKQYDRKISFCNTN